MSGPWAHGAHRRGVGSGCWPTGVSENDLVTLHAPIGLDIGADQPAEIALSILAEVVAVRAGRRSGTSAAVTPIADRSGAIHPEHAAGEATCPGG